MYYYYEDTGTKTQGRFVWKRPCCLYNYAMKQADKVLKVKHDWSIFEHDCAAFGKVDGTHLLRKSVGSIQSIAHLLS